MSKPKRHDIASAWEAVQAADEALATVDALRRLRKAAEKAEDEAVRAARNQGISWSRIGALYGLTKQGAQQRFKPRM